MRRQKAVRVDLVHQRIGPERRRHIRAARFSDQLDMVYIRRAVDPLIGARERRRAGRLIERLRGKFVAFQRLGSLLKTRRMPVPIIECGLQRGRDTGCVGGARQIAGHDEQPAVATGFTGCKLHDAGLIEDRAGLDQTAF